MKLRDRKVATWHVDADIKSNNLSSFSHACLLACSARKAFASVARLPAFRQSGAEPAGAVCKQATWWLVHWGGLDAVKLAARAGSQLTWFRIVHVECQGACNPATSI